MTKARLTLPEALREAGASDSRGDFPSYKWLAGRCGVSAQYAHQVIRDRYPELAARHKNRCKHCGKEVGK